MDSVIKIPIVRIGKIGKQAVGDMAVEEYLLGIFRNNRELMTLLCDLSLLEYPAAGFLPSTELIRHKIQSEITVSAQERFVLFGDFMPHSLTSKSTPTSRRSKTF